MERDELVQLSDVIQGLNVQTNIGDPLNPRLPIYYYRQIPVLRTASDDTRTEQERDYALMDAERKLHDLQVLLNGLNFKEALGLDYVPFVSTAFNMGTTGQLRQLGLRNEARSYGDAAVLGIGSDLATLAGGYYLYGLRGPAAVGLKSAMKAGWNTAGNIGTKAINAIRPFGKYVGNYLTSPRGSIMTGLAALNVPAYANNFINTDSPFGIEDVVLLARPMWKGLRSIPFGRFRVPSINTVGKSLWRGVTKYPEIPIWGAIKAGKYIYNNLQKLQQQEYIKSLPTGDVSEEYFYNYNY